MKYFVELSAHLEFGCPQLQRQEKRTTREGNGEFGSRPAATVADLSYLVACWPRARQLCSVPKVWTFLVAKAVELRRQQHVNIGKVIAHSHFPDCSSSFIGPTFVFFQIYVFKLFIERNILSNSCSCLYWEKRGNLLLIEIRVIRTLYILSSRPILQQ